MLTIHEYSPELQEHMRTTAEIGLALARIERDHSVSALEQLNAHQHPNIGDARVAIVLTMVLGEAVFLDPTQEV